MGILLMNILRNVCFCVKYMFFMSRLWRIPSIFSFDVDLKIAKDSCVKEKKERIKAEREREEAISNSERRFTELQV